jgi:mono/diheme cytochrome c family protein
MTLCMNGRVQVFVLMAGLCCWAQRSFGDATPAAIDFGQAVRPIFERHCYECHGEQKQKAGIRFDRKSVIFKGGDSGKPVVVPGKSSDSLLIQKITATDPDEVMPPKGARVSEADVALLRKWIDGGAAWPEEAEKKHWAYVKPARPALPTVQNAEWPKNGIDYFVLARLEQERLKPSPQADAAMLLRRASLDLRGLPPTTEEVDAFLSDPSALAYENAVDSFLASPQYGERWARPWLDLARYADTQGYEKDSRRTIWPYRDWVINALNDDMPFDEFTIEQIAGDLLPDATQGQKVATSFHRNTMTNTEGGTDNEEFRHEAVIDRINTTMSVWMGSTFNCSQCHNHKYDPFTMREYYQFYAFLNNTADADNDDEEPFIKVFKPGQDEKLAELRDAMKGAEKKFNEAAAQPEIIAAQKVWEEKSARGLTNWQVLDPMSFASAGGATFTKTESKSLLASGKNPSNDVYTVTAHIDSRVAGIRLEVLETGTDRLLGRHPNGNFILTKFEVKAAAKGAEAEPVPLKSATADYAQEGHPVTNLLAGTGNGWAIGASDKKLRVRRSAYFALEKPVEFPEGATLTFALIHGSKNPEANIARFRLYATGADAFEPPAQVPDDVRAALLAVEDRRDEKQRQQLKEYFHSVAPELKRVREPLETARKAEKEFADAIPTTPVMVELEKPRSTHMLTRGNFLSKGEKVNPGTPAVLHPLPSGAPTNRLGLARWLVDTNNPLTARVMMNRFWEQYFGRGIVETAEDFGIQGEKPSHPQLLDWLSCEFMQQGWSMKAMHKLIVMSATYRQSSRASAEMLQRDPYNRLCARGPRTRLDAETLRDQALAVSGLLSKKLGGPSVFPPQPEGLWQVVYSGDKWQTSKGDDRYRRALYTFWRRTMPHPAMTTFDAPSREFCVVKRTRSNTPLQALLLLNDPAYVECAQALARRVMREAESTPEARASHAFRLCLARQPKPDEVHRLTQLYQQQLSRYKEDLSAAEKMATSELGVPPDGMNLQELAAWTVVANVILNLDEMITKG